jgi:hypothetical protein
MAKQSLLEMLLPTPDQIVRSYLTTDENLVLVDRPSTNAFIVEASRQLILFAIIVLVLIAWVGDCRIYRLRTAPGEPAGYLGVGLGPLSGGGPDEGPVGGGPDAGTLEQRLVQLAPRSL